MKLITAIIQPDKLEEVREALIKEKITRITVSRCAGRGQASEVDLYRGKQIVPELISKIRLDIAVNDEFVDVTIEAISRVAKHGDGKIGDGKIFVSPLEECVRIRTDEKGGKAI